MTVTRFYPYKTAPNGLELELKAVDPPTVRVEDGVIWADDDDIESTEIELHVKFSDATLEQVLPPDERRDPPARLAVLLKTTEGRRRTTATVGEDGIAQLSLAKSEWVGTVDIQAVLLRSAETTQTGAGYGAHRGALLAWSPTITLHIDEPSRPTGDLLPVRWVRFTEQPGLRSKSEHLFSLAPGNPPKILLNSDVRQLQTVLDNRGTHGVKARIRDAVFLFQIGHQVWTSLLVSAVDSLVEQAEMFPDRLLEDLLEELTPWEKAILRRWAPDLYPEEEPEEALSVLVDDASGSGSSELFIIRIPDAIQQKLETYAAFEGLAKDSGLRRALEVGG